MPVRQHNAFKVVLWLIFHTCSTALVFAQLSPAESVKALRSADGLDVKLFASEPMITNPSCIDVDAHGRVWVAEIQWYRGKAKNPPADKIKVLEDTDGDGVADRATVFVDGLLAPMSVCVVGDRVYAFVKGELLMWEDKNGDLKADGPAKVVLKGFSNQNHDHTAHSIVVGPDHKWYMAHGDTGYDVTGNDGSHIKSRWGAMVRGELDGTKLENVATNFRNPYEICVNSFGQMYCSDNDNDGNQATRVCWILEGGDYGWFGSPPFNLNQLDQRVPVGTPFREAWHFRGYVPGFVPATVQTGFGSPCGMCYYESDAFGPKLRNAPLHCDPGPREVRVYRHEEAGFGQKGSKETFLTTKDDKYFRPDDICAAPDGSLYVSDWYDGGVGGHAYNDPDRGRIYRITPAGKRLASPSKPGPYTTLDDAAVALRNVNLDMQFQAREKFLSEGAKSLPTLTKLLTDGDHNVRARALWLCDRIGGEGLAIVRKQLSSEEETFRALAVRILGRHGESEFANISASCHDPAKMVRREALLALRNLSDPKVVPLLANAAQAYDGEDRYELETLNIAAGSHKTELAKMLLDGGKVTPKLFALVQLLDPKTASEVLARRLADPQVDRKTALEMIDSVGNMTDVAAGRTLIRLMVAKESSPAIQTRAMSVIGKNLAGVWRALADDKGLQETARSVLKEGAPEARSAALELVLAGNWRDAAPEIAALAADTKQDPKLRVKAIEAALVLRGEGIVDTLRALRTTDVPEIRKIALAGLTTLQDFKSVRETLLDPKTTDAERATLVENTLRSSSGALGLLKLVEDRSLAANVAALIVERGTKHPDVNVRIVYEKFIPADKRERKLGDVIKADDILKLTGDAARGQRIFADSNAAQCKNCHSIHGSGGLLGPDLSLIGKKYERATLLETILQPSKAISHGYEAYLLETTAGQTYLGFLSEDDGQHVVLKDINSQTIRVPKTEIESLEKQSVSLMPELILKDVTVQDAADLLSYLSTLVEAMTPAGSLRMIGPFPGKNLDHVHEIERAAAAPDLKKTYRSMGKKEAAWEVVASDGKLGFPGIDTVKFDRARGEPDADCTHYALIYVESLTDQKGKLLIGSDDGCKVWLNGAEILRNDATRGLKFPQETLPIELKRGRNVVLVKVVNGNPPGGIALGIRAADAVTLKTE